MPDNNKTKIWFASTNKKKLGEMHGLLDDITELHSVEELPDFSEPIEDGLTFRDNSVIKALALSHHVSGLVLADDSGLEVDALHGLPGVKSSRFAGDDATDADNRRKLLTQLAALPTNQATSRRARFRCVLALAENNQIIATTDGTVEGSIALKECGDAGFGYDSIFIPDGYAKTFAELGNETKAQLSHRAAATIAMRPNLIP